MKVFIIGSGNVATQLGLALKREGLTITAVCSRTASHARKLAKQLRSSYGTNIKKMCSDIKLAADVYLIAVNDDSIAKVVSQLSIPANATVVHTSGATDIAALKKKFKLCGVIWQAQTIKKHSRTDFKKIPLIIEGNNSKALKTVRSLAKKLSPKIHVHSSHQRRILHLAAVWINNFPNHLFYLGEKLLKKNKLSYEIFAPLIVETAMGGIRDPRNAQTGPAKRNDLKTLKAHLKLLPEKNYRTLYKIISASIYKTYKA